MSLKTEAPQIYDKLKKNTAEHVTTMRKTLNDILDSQQELLHSLSVDLLAHVKNKEMELEAYEQQLYTEQEQFKRQVKEHFERNKEIIEIQEKVKKISASTATQIQLNVGGTVFHTSVAVLLAEPDSLFSAMFSDAFSERTESEYFIDRNPKVFGIILDHLRGYGMAPQISKLAPSLKNQLKEEIAFYRLPSMLKLFPVETKPVVKPVAKEPVKPVAKEQPKDTKTAPTKPAEPEQKTPARITVLENAVYVTGLQKTTKEEIEQYFKVWGDIVILKKLRRGAALIEYAKRNSAKNAISNLDGSIFKEGTLTVSVYKPKE
jgi:RNA recognition motif-containing protein